VIDHLELAVSDLPRARAFYERALAPLGYTVHVPGPSIGLGAAADRLDFWLKPGAAATPPPHFAFGCASRALVGEAFDAALAAGGSAPRPPALLPHIHPSYYAAFVLDPDGHLVEFVCQQP
jgi:catechol 2,3-dioxygenase-like lactoylglutathione lyase family enzyme